MIESLKDTLVRLDEQEILLTTLFEEIEYIGEVPLRREDFTLLTHDLKFVQTGMGLTNTTRMLRNQWPHIFVTYLSITAAYNDNRGYWQAVVDKLDITSTQSIFSGNNHWGKLYLELLDQFGLDNFSNAKLSFPYVTPIRLQGGIPRYSLPDFFEYIILPTVEKPGLVLLDDDEAYVEVQSKSDARYRVDRVIKLYMKHGEEFAERFFSRTREMARYAVKGEPIPAPSTLKLRPYVVHLFEDYLENRVERKTSRRIFSPRLTFWPHQPAYSLSLPEQIIPEGSAHRKYHWRIRLFSEKQIVQEELIAVRVHRKGYEIQTKSKEIPIEQPYEQAVVEFGFMKIVSENKPGDENFHSIRRWPIRLLPEPEQPPIMSFNNQGIVIHHMDGLPADYCWLLIPQSSIVKVDGSGKCLEEITTYWSPWDHWKAELWDLSGVHLLEVYGEAGKKITALPVVQPIPEPELQGENRLQHSRPINDIPLFIGSPPRLTFPGAKQGENSGQLSDLEAWSLVINSLGVAEPEIDQRFTLSDKKFEFKQENGVLNFSFGEILGERPIGYYDVCLIHRDGKEFDRSFKIWPHLEIQGLEPLFIPDREGGKTVELKFFIPQKTYLDCISETNYLGKRITINPSPVEDESNQLDIIIPPGLSSGVFTLSYPKDQEFIHIPFELCIPRLKWSIRFEDTDVHELNWHTELQNIPLPKLTQADHAVLYVAADLPRESSIKIGLSLSLPGKEKSLLKLAERIMTDHEPRCSCNIKTILDTIKALESEPFFDLVLTIEADHLNKPVSLSVVRLTRTIDVRNVSLQKLDEGNWMLHWKEPKPLHNRRIQLWSIWQPWHKPIEIRLPEDTPSSNYVKGDSWYMHELPLELAPLIDGCYGVRFIAVPTWEERPIPAFPPLDDVKYVQTGDPEQRIKWIKEKLETDPSRTFPLHFERICIHHDLSNEKDRDQDIAWCSSNADKASIPLLISFYYWLNEKDPFTQKALRMRMYQPEWVRKLFEKHESIAVRRKYLKPILKQKSIDPKSARMILDHADYPDLVSKAINSLIEVKDDYVIKHMLAQVELSRFSVLGAFEILKPCADFALFSLLDLPDSSVRSRLLQELSEYTKKPLLIYPGWWIRSDAGWGQIKKIIEQESGSEVNYFRIDREKPLLEVTLRPGEHALDIQIDLGDSQILFFENDELYLCTHHTGCFNYISNNRAEIRSIHTRIAHGGIQPAFRLIRNNVYSMRQNIQYSAQPPKNLYV